MRIIAGAALLVRRRLVMSGFRCHSSMKDLLSRLKNNKTVNEVATNEGKPAAISGGIPASKAVPSGGIPVSSPATNTVRAAKVPEVSAPSTANTIKESSASRSRLTDILRASSNPSLFGTGSTGLNQSSNVFSKNKGALSGANTNKFSENILQKTLSSSSPSIFKSALLKDAPEPPVTVKSKFTVDARPAASAAAPSKFSEIFRNNADSINNTPRGNNTSIREAQRNATDRLRNNQTRERYNNIDEVEQRVSSQESRTRPISRMTNDAASAVTGTLADLGVDPSGIDVDDVTEGELRHLQKQEHLKKSKSFLQRKWGGVIGDQPERYVRSAFPPAPSLAMPLGINDLKERMKQELSYKKNNLTRNNGRDTNVAVKKERVDTGTIVKEVVIPSDGLKVKELASKLSMKIDELVKKLEEAGAVDKTEIVRYNQSKKRKNVEVNDENSLEFKQIDADSVELIVLELGLDSKRVASQEDIEKSKSQLPSTKSLDPNHHLESRAPVVCIMGHVDHGKTTLLDYLRSANVAADEAGGITQKISAFKFKMKSKEVVFLDTPGHAAFNAMRANGAAATDLVVLVVAIDDGVRPQTVEAIKLAKSAGCSVIIALNKIDKIPVQDRKASKARVLAQLIEHELVPEEYGGDALVVEIAGKSGEGIETLVETIALQADVLELKAVHEGYAEATVLEAAHDKGKGVVADMLVSWGRLSVGDPIVVGTAFGKVRAIYDDKGKQLPYAGPSTPVRVIGLREVPSSGQELITVSSEGKAKSIAERRKRVADIKAARLAVLNKDVDPDEVNTPLALGPMKVPVILKADGVGTLEALNNVIKGLSERTQDVEVQVKSSGIGAITMTDVEKAATIGNATILAFNVGYIDGETRSAAKEMDISVVSDTVIYRLEDELSKKILDQMPKERVLILEGTGKVLKVFDFKNKAATQVGGLMVTSGVMRHSGDKYVYTVKRGNDVVQEEVTCEMLKRFKDTVHEVQQGTECGIALNNFKQFQEGDEVECYKVVYQVKEMIVESVN